MPLANVRRVSHSLVFRYQQNLPNLFCSCSQHNRGYFIIIFFYYFRVCVFFRPAKASAKRARSARNARGGKALHALFTLALASKRQTYFRSSLLSLRSDDRKFVCCSQAALAFARLKNAKKTACCAGYHSWAEIKGGIYEKQKTKQAHRQEEKVLSVKKQNVF